MKHLTLISLLFIASALHAKPNENMEVKKEAPNNLMEQKAHGEALSAKNNLTKWRMIWNEEFNSDSMPNPKYWSYEEGLVRNNEEQEYMVARNKNTRIDSGRLIIEAHFEKIPNKKFRETSGTQWNNVRKFSEYSSASITTQKIDGFQYGRIEVSAKLPRGQGVWPAIWMLGKDRSQVGWPKCGEIDIMEYVNSSPKTIFGTCHWATAEGAKHASKGGKKVLESQDTLHEKFHIYALEWNDKEMKIFFDDENYFTFDISQDAQRKSIFNKPYYLLLNLAVGGAWGGKADSKIFPKQFEVDFVRVYKPVTDSVKQTQ